MKLLHGGWLFIILGATLGLLDTYGQGQFPGQKSAPTASGWTTLDKFEYMTPVATSFILIAIGIVIIIHHHMSK